MKRPSIFQGLSLKMIVAIFSTVSILIVVILAYIYEVSRHTIELNLRENSNLLTVATVNRIERILAVVQKVPENLAKILENGDYSEAEMKRLLSVAVANNQEIYGSAIAFETGFNGNKEKYNSIYVYKSKLGIESGPLGNENYDYFTMDWYQIPKELGRSTWSEPYYDEGGGNIVMTTYSVPLYRIKDGHRRFIGVLTADISLEWLQDLFDSIKIYQTGYAFMISRNGSLVAHPRREFIMNETVFSIAEEIKSQQLREIGRAMVQGKTSIAEQEYHNVTTGKLSWVSFAPITINRWSLGIVYPVDELTAPLRKLLRIAIVLSVVGLIVLLFVISFIARSMTSPLRKLALATQEIGQGSFDVELPKSESHDEI
ncbi:MAG: Cache 3/Cache 2 fusion domain-containing protein, partial [Candidatus Delongbacteria bacterium]|nr:Cache 3/Cache 2 fusion domain-containing protein [Candidatus Delongbacteria bacterium]